jgi:hypothetical protein
MTMPTHTQNRKLLCVATGVRRSTDALKVEPCLMGVERRI